MDSFVEFNPDVVCDPPPCPGTVLGSAVAKEIAYAGEQTVGVTFQRTRVAQGSAVQIIDYKLYFDPTLRYVHAYNSDFSGHREPSISIMDVAAASGHSNQVEIWHSAFHTDRSLEGMPVPPAIDLGVMPLDPTDVHTIYNTAFAGHTADIVGGLPTSLAWDGIATDDPTTFTSPVPGQILTDLTCPGGQTVDCGLDSWFSVPEISPGVPDPAIPPEEAHVKPVPPLRDQGSTVIAANPLVAETLYGEPRDSLPDIGADEAWHSRVWKTNQPLVGQKFYIRAMDIQNAFYALQPYPNDFFLEPVDNFDPLGMTQFIDVVPILPEFLTFDVLSTPVQGTAFVWHEDSLTLQPVPIGGGLELFVPGTWIHYQAVLVDLSQGPNPVARFSCNDDTSWFLE